MSVIAQEDLPTTTIGDTDVSIAELIETFLRTQDGRYDKDMEDQYGPELAESVIRVRKAILPVSGRI